MFRFAVHVRCVHARLCVPLCLLSTMNSAPHVLHSVLDLSSRYLCLSPCFLGPVRMCASAAWFAVTSSTHVRDRNFPHPTSLVIVASQVLTERRSLPNSNCFCPCFRLPSNFSPVNNFPPARKKKAKRLFDYTPHISRSASPCLTLDPPPFIEQRSPTSLEGSLAPSPVGSYQLMANFTLRSCSPLYSL